MQVQSKILKSLTVVELSADESKILGWLRKTKWAPVAGARDPIPYKTKVPEFFDGVRLYRMQAGATGAAQAPLEFFIKKLQFQGVIHKQDMYPLTTEAGAKYLALRKEDLDNLGVGQEEDED